MFCCRPNALVAKSLWRLWKTCGKIVMNGHCGVLMRQLGHVRRTRKSGEKLSSRGEPHESSALLAWRARETLFALWRFYRFLGHQLYFWNKSFGKLQAENARGVEKQHGRPAEPQSDHLLRTLTPTLFPTRSAAAKHAAMQPQVAMLAEATAPRPAPWPARTSRVPEEKTRHALTAGLLRLHEDVDRLSPARVPPLHVHHHPRKRADSTFALTSAVRPRHFLTGDTCTHARRCLPDLWQISGKGRAEQRRTRHDSIGDRGLWHGASRAHTHERFVRW